MGDGTYELLGIRIDEQGVEIDGMLHWNQSNPNAFLIVISEEESRCRVRVAKR